MKHPPAAPELMTVADFLNTFNISRSEFYREVGRKNLSIVKIGRATRVRRRDADAWSNALPHSGSNSWQT